MAEQFSLFGDPAPRKPELQPKAKGGLEPYSLFFSLFPAPGDAVEIANFYRALLQAHGFSGTPLLPHRLHVTLHDLGNYAELPQDMVDKAIKAGNALACDAFDVAFDCALSYPSSETFVLSGGDGTRHLTAFREELGESMKSQGLKVKTSFIPHMTLIYDRRVIAEHAVDPVRWRAQEFVLIRSHRGKGVYDVLGRWPLAE